MRKAVLKIAYTLGIGAAVALCLGLVGCGKEQLATPQGVTVEKRIVSWEAVDGAESYTVTVNGEEFTTQECSYSLYAFTEGGEYTVTVSAEAEGYIPSVGASVLAQLQEAPFHGFDEAGYEYLILEDCSGYEISRGTVNTDEALVLPDYFGDYPITQVAENGFVSYKFYQGTLCDSTMLDSYAPSIALPKYLKRISKGAFAKYVALEELVIPEGVEEIGVGAFLNAKLKRLTLPSTLKKLGNSAFSGHCLEELTLPEGLEEIGNYAFQASWSAETSESKIESLRLPASLKSIGFGAFANNAQLERIDALCKDLEYIDSNSFEGTAWYEAQSRGMVYLGADILYCFKGEMFHSDVLEGVLRIEDVSIVAEEAFIKDNCATLNEALDIYISDGVILCDRAFVGFDYLGNVRLPADMKRFPYELFKRCQTMQSITIPKTIVDPIDEEHCFFGFHFYSLKKVYIEGTMEDWKAICPPLSAVFSSNLYYGKIINAAEVYVYSAESPTKEGKYWRYVEGEIVEW